MSIGTMGDPNKCSESLTYLGLQTLGYGASVWRGMKNESVLQNMAQTTGAIAVGSFMLKLAYGKMFFPSNIISAGRNAWQDCDGGGWLKKHLDSMKAKVNVAIDKAKSLAPQPKPVPIASYAVSPEAMAAARPSGLGLFARDAANAAENVLLPAVVIGGLVFGALKAAETGDISTMQRAFAMAVR